LTERDESAFFSGIRLANGTFKTTAPGRMRELDGLLARLVRERGPTNPAVLDIGASSGVTTLELREAMLAAGLAPTLVATDMAVRAEIRDAGPGFKVLVDAAQRPLQYELLGFGIRAWNRRLDYLTGYWLLTKAAQLLARNRTPAAGRAVHLVSRRVSAAGAFDFIENDLGIHSSVFETRFDVIRAANILNLDYFDEPALRGMLRNLVSYARGPGALIVINRTHADGRNHATIFQAADRNRLVPLERLGNGSEIERLALSPCVA
jgi:hypothetical protein